MPLKTRTPSRAAPRTLPLLVSTIASGGVESLDAPPLPPGFAEAGAETAASSPLTPAAVNRPRRSTPARASLLPLAMKPLPRSRFGRSDHPRRSLAMTLRSLAGAVSVAYEAIDLSRRLRPGADRLRVERVPHVGCDHAGDIGLAIAAASFVHGATKPCAALGVEGGSNQRRFACPPSPQPSRRPPAPRFPPGAARRRSPSSGGPRNRWPRR